MRVGATPGVRVGIANGARVGADDACGFDPWFGGGLRSDDTGGRVYRRDVDGLLHPVTTAGLSMPMALAVGPDGSVFIAEAGRVRRVSPRGTITTAVGPGTGKGFLGQSAIAASLGGKR